MTYQSKYRQNQSLIKRYLDYLPEVDNYEARLKLITEIARLNEQNQYIDQMPFNESKQEYPDYTLTVKSLFL